MKLAEKTGLSEEYIESNEEQRDPLAILNNGFYSGGMMREIGYQLDIY